MSGRLRLVPSTTAQPKYLTEFRTRDTRIRLKRVQVFISYSHNASDTPLARYLAGRLRAIGVEVWQDESSQAAGESLQADIEKAIRESDHAIFLVSKLWLSSRWSRLEVDRFDHRDRSRVRRIPIFRLPRERLMLPMELIDLKGITWLEEEPHHDARFWEVYCAVTDKDPGPADQWAAQSAALTQASVPPPMVRPVTPTLASLRCDRGLQWNRVTDVEPEPSHDLLLVPGAAGQAHDHFSRRIREMLPAAPPRSIVSVHWRKRPASRNEFFSALADDFEVSLDYLPRELAERMSDSNLVLLHPCLRARFMDAALISYYTDWLPSLLQEVAPRMSLKCVQPVEWPGEAGTVSTVLSWLRLKPGAADEGKPEAERFIEQIRNGTASRLRSIRLQDLADITPADLEEFCQTENLTTTQKTWLLTKMKSRSPRNSEEVLEAIDAFLPDARSVT
ncbi:MAG: TIR domain-containing protein [Vicinamibacterales bacterium]